MLPRRWLCTRAPPPDPYQVLGVPPGASPEQIRAAFLQRCKEVHPDGDPADPSRHGRFQRLAEAYGALRRRPPRPPPAGETPPGETPPRPGAPPRTRTTGAAPPPRSRYWSQFRPPGPPPAPPQRRRVLGLCLLLAALGAAAHGLAYRYVAGAHSAFMDERDRALTAAYERSRARAGSRQEVLQRLREARRGRGGARGGNKS